MWTRSLPGSSDRASSATALRSPSRRRSPIAARIRSTNVDLERFLGIFTTDAHRIVDARDLGLLGIIMDRLTITDGAKPFEWIGGRDREDRHARSSRSCSNACAARRAALRNPGDRHHAERPLGERARPAGARRRPSAIRRYRADPRRLRLGSGPSAAARLALGAGVARSRGRPISRCSIAAWARCRASTCRRRPRRWPRCAPRPTAPSCCWMTDGEAQAMVRCKLAKRYLHLIACAPEMKGRGLGRLALDEVRRMLGPGPLHLTVVKQNAARARFLSAYGLRRRPKKSRPGDCRSHHERLGP